MLRFLAALLHDNSPSVCYWVVPVRQETEKERLLKALPDIYFDDDGRSARTDRSDYRCELSENEHAKEKRTERFVALWVHPDLVGWGRRSIYPKRGFREPRL